MLGGFYCKPFLALGGTVANIMSQLFNLIGLSDVVLGGRSQTRALLINIDQKYFSEPNTCSSSNYKLILYNIITVCGCTDTSVHQLLNSGFHFDSPIRQTDRQTDSEPDDIAAVEHTYCPISSLTVVL